MAFDRVAELTWETAIAREDIRRDYGERRVRVIAYLGTRLHVAVITHRDDAVHVISFRRANKKEVKWYGEERRESGLPAGR